MHISTFWLPALCRHSHFRSRAAEGARHGPPKLRLKFEVARQTSSRSLSASVRAVPWAGEVDQHLSRLAPSTCQLSADIRIFRSGLPKNPGRDPPFPRILLKFEVARQANSPSLCSSVRAVPWAHEAEQQHSRLAPSGCQLSADVHIFRAGRLETPGTDPQRYVSSLRWQDKQAASVSVPLCEQCHWQIRLSNSFPG